MRGRVSIDEQAERLDRLYSEANLLEDQLQRKVFEIDKLRMDMESRGEMISMVKIQKLAMKLRLMRAEYDQIVAEG